MLSMKTSKETGISLIEVMIALVILSIGFISLAKFQTTIFHNNVLAKQRTQATILAQNTIERFRNIIISNNSLVNISSGSEGIKSETTLYERSWEITILSSGTVSIKVTVTWPDIFHGDANQKNPQIVLSSLISKQGHHLSGLPKKIQDFPHHKLISANTIKP